MKITREFIFYPSWSSREWSWKTYEDRFLVPSFNEMVKILNDRGWEVDSYRIIEDTRYYNRDSEFNTYVFMCSKKVKGKYKEEQYTYIACDKNGGVKLYD